MVLPTGVRLLSTVMLSHLSDESRFRATSISSVSSIREYARVQPALSECVKLLPSSDILRKYCLPYLKAGSNDLIVAMSLIFW